MALRLTKKSLEIAFESLWSYRDGFIKPENDSEKTDSNLEKLYWENWYNSFKNGELKELQCQTKQGERYIFKKNDLVITLQKQNSKVGLISRKFFRTEKDFLDACEDLQLRPLYI